MIPYERTRQQTIPNSAVKIIGVGGAGANMLDRIALDGMEGAELLGNFAPDVKVVLGPATVREELVAKIVAAYDAHSKTSSHD